MTFRPIGVKNDRPVIKKTDGEFLYLIQHAALLGLKDAVYLTQMQYRQAEEKLRQQHREKPGADSDD